MAEPQPQPVASPASTFPPGTAEHPDTTKQPADNDREPGGGEGAEPGDATSNGTIEIPERPHLAPNVELSGEMQEGGFADKQWLLQRDGRFVQVTELIYRVAEQATGNQTPEEMAAAVSEATGRRVSADNIGYLLTNKLIPMGLVEQADGTVAAAAGANAPGSALQVRMKLKMIGPEYIEPATLFLQVLFKPYLLIPVLLICLAAQLWVFFVHGVAGGVHQAMYSPALMLVVLGIIVLSTIFHEFGHAAALRYGGGKVRGMGAGLYIVYPAFYTDVTDNYRLPRWSRVRTDLGGFYFNWIFNLGLVALYLLTREEIVLLPVVLINIEIIHQCLPFVRLDGYWALADATGIPDLFTHIGPFLRTVLPFTSWKGRKLPTMKRWVRNVFGTYVLLTIPILLFILFMMIKSVPRILATAWDSAGQQTDAFSLARDSGDAAGMAAAIAQTGILALPTLGLIYSLFGMGKRATKGLYAWSKPTPLRRMAGSTIGVVAVALLAYLWVPQLPSGGGPNSAAANARSPWTPIRSDERGRIQDAARDLPVVSAVIPATVPTWLRVPDVARPATVGPRDIAAPQVAVATSTPTPTPTLTPTLPPTATATATVNVIAAPPPAPSPTATSSPPTVPPTATNPLPTSTPSPVPTAPPTARPTKTPVPPTSTPKPLPTRTRPAVPTALPTRTPTAHPSQTPLTVAEVDTATATREPTATSTVVPPTPRPTASDTPSPAPTATATETPRPSPTVVPPTETATPAPIDTATATATRVPPTRTATPEPTATQTATPRPSPTPLPPTATATATMAPTDTATPKSTATSTPTLTPAPTDTPVPTATTIPTETATAIPTATDTLTPVPTETATATATDTPTLVPTDTATASPPPTQTPTLVPTDTATPEPTATATATATRTATSTSTPRPTETETPLPTATNSPEPTATPTSQSTATSIPTVSPSTTPTGTPISTSTVTAAPSPVATEAATGTTASPGATPTADVLLDREELLQLVRFSPWAPPPSATTDAKSCATGSDGSPVAGGDDNTTGTEAGQSDCRADAQTPTPVGTPAGTPTPTATATANTQTTRTPQATVTPATAAQPTSTPVPESQPTTEPAPAPTDEPVAEPTEVPVEEPTALPEEQPTATSDE